MSHQGTASSKEQVIFFLFLNFRGNGLSSSLAPQVLVLLVGGGLFFYFYFSSCHSMRANSQGWGGEGKKSRKHRTLYWGNTGGWECEQKLLSQGKSNPNLGMAAKGVACEAAGLLVANNHGINQLSHTETAYLEHLSEINTLVLAQKTRLGWVCLSCKHYCNLFVFPRNFLGNGTRCFFSPVAHPHLKLC